MMDLYQSASHIKTLNNNKEVTTMVTRVYFKEICGNNHKTRIFETFTRETLKVNSFKNGIAVIEIYSEQIIKYSELIAGCFEEDSNFEAELCEAFDCDPATTLDAILLESTGKWVTLLVTKENADKDKINAEWEASVKDRKERDSLEFEAYWNSPKFIAKLAKSQKSGFRKRTVMKEVTYIDKSTELEFKDDEARAKWERWVVEINPKDCNHSNDVNHARRWAKYMQHLMNKYNKPLSMIAYEASQVTGYSDSVYGDVCAVAMLSQCWKYGKELRVWYKQRRSTGRR